MAQCHKFSRWYYPWPQRCPVVARVATPTPPVKDIAYDIPIPELTPVAGGEPVSDVMRQQMLLLGYWLK